MWPARGGHGCLFECTGLRAVLFPGPGHEILELNSYPNANINKFIMEAFWEEN